MCEANTAPTGRRVTHTSADGDLLKYEYDAANNLTRITYPPDATHPTGKQVSYTFHEIYDDDNRLATLNGQPIVHDADGNMTSGPLTASSGTLALSYNSRNQLTNAAGVSYSYDAEGARRSMTSAAGPTRYTIDKNAGLSRLLVKHNPDGTKTCYVYGMGLLYESTKAGAAPEQG